MARALILQPDVLLLDEPFSALDAQVRESTRLKMRSVQRETNTTAPLVTHGQEEAMSIADKIMVMNKGRVEQIGSPMDIYDRPATKFVAEFIGSANLMAGEIVSANCRYVTMRTGCGVSIDFEAEEPLRSGARGYATIRGQDIAISKTQVAASNGCA